MDIKGLPERPIRLYETTLLEKNKNIINVEPVFYENNNINATVCMLINIENEASIVGLDPKDNKWKLLSKVSSEESKNEYIEESDNVIDWVNNKYGEDGYGIYGDEDI